MGTPQWMATSLRACNLMAAGDDPLAFADDVIWVSLSGPLPPT